MPISIAFLFDETKTGKMRGSWEPNCVVLHRDIFFIKNIRVRTKKKNNALPHIFQRHTLNRTLHFFGVVVLLWFTVRWNWENAGFLGTQLCCSSSGYLFHKNFSESGRKKKQRVASHFPKTTFNRRTLYFFWVLVLLWFTVRWNWENVGFLGTQLCCFFFIKILSWSTLRWFEWP